MTSADILVIGGGIAGASAAYALSASASVLVLETEAQPGYHATGRSAASFTENYGTATIRRLARASRSFLEDPPDGFSAHPILQPRGMITVARADQTDALAAELVRANLFRPDIASISVEEVLARVPILRPGYVAEAIIEPHSMEVDVDGLHQGYLRGAKARGARLVTNAEVVGISRSGSAWTVDTRSARYAGAILVNAAGAWADTVARLAGVRPLGLVPRRRTALHVALPPELEPASWPMINDVGEEFYFKPDAGRLFVSPADQTPSQPCDAQADEYDVAVAVDRLEQATMLQVRRVLRSWAGLRTFAADGSPVVGFDEEAPGFMWLAGQGGYGIKTSYALSRICAGLVGTGALPAEAISVGLKLEDLWPRRLRPSPAQAAMLETTA